MIRLTAFTLRRRARVLGEWWDSFLHRANPSDISAPADAELADLILSIHRTWHQVESNRPGEDRILTGLLAKQQELNSMTTRPLGAFPLTPGRTRHDVTARITRRLPVAAALSLVLATLLLGIWQHGALRDDSEQIMAILAPDTDPRDTVVDETLLVVDIPAELAPTGDAQSSGFARFSVPAGSATSWANDCCTGPEVEYVLAGEYVVQATTSIVVFRQDGTVESVPANQAVTLMPGDALMASRHTTADVGSANSEPVDILSWVWTDNTAEFSDPGSAGDWKRIGFASVHHEPFEAGTTVRLTLRRVSAPSGSVIPGPGDESQFVYALPHEQVGVGIGMRSDGSVEVFTKSTYTATAQPLTVYIMTASTVKDIPATPET